MKVVKQLPDGTYVDAETGKDLSDLLAAYERAKARIMAGHLGGSASTAAKRRAARLNGAKGGRPKGSKNQRTS
jgi:hypothetical protein